MTMSKPGPGAAEVENFVNLLCSRCAGGTGYLSQAGTETYRGLRNPISF